MAAELSVRLRWLLTLGVGVLVVGLLLWWRQPPESDPAALLPAVIESGPAATATVALLPAEIGVDVVGAVQRPGLYFLPEGARVADAVEAAGGLSPAADRDAVNFAQRLQDEQQLRVPRVGEAVQVAAGATIAPTTSSRIDLNEAGVDALQAIPGIGPVTANLIVEYRTTNGPFRSIDDLDNVTGIGPATIEVLRQHAVVNP